MSAVENPTGSKPTSLGRVPSKVSGVPVLAHGRASEGQFYDAAKAEVDLGTDADWKAAADPIRAEVMASFIVDLD